MVALCKTSMLLLGTNRWRNTRWKFSWQLVTEPGLTNAYCNVDGYTNIFVKVYTNRVIISLYEFMAVHGVGYNMSIIVVYCS